MALTVSFATKAALIATIIRWLDRDDLNDQVPDFLFMTECDLAEALEIETDRVVLPIATVSGSDSIATPADMLTPKSIEFSVLGNAQPVDIVGEAAWVARKGRAPSSGPPEMARLRGTTIALSPMPDADYSGVLEYIAGPIHLVNDEDTSELLKTSPQALLFGSLLCAAPYLQGDDRAALWQTYFDRAEKGARRRQFRRKWSGGRLRVRSDIPTP